jgi:hypothetical protein
MSNFTRTLITGAMLAAMHLAGMTAAHAHATDQRAALRPPSEGQVGEAWRHRQAPSRQQAAADAALKRVLARERFSVPSGTPAPVPAPPPDTPSGQPRWLIASLAVLVAALALAVLAARRTRRRARPRHAARARVTP